LLGSSVQQTPPLTGGAGRFNLTDIMNNVDNGSSGPAPDQDRSAHAKEWFQYTLADWATETQCLSVEALGVTLRLSGVSWLHGPIALDARTVRKAGCADPALIDELKDVWEEVEGGWVFPPLERARDIAVEFRAKKSQAGRKGGKQSQAKLSTAKQSQAEPSGASVCSVRQDKTGQDKTRQNPEPPSPLPGEPDACAGGDFSNSRIHLSQEAIRERVRQVIRTCPGVSTFPDSLQAFAGWIDAKFEAGHTDPTERNLRTWLAILIDICPSHESVVLEVLEDATGSSWKSLKRSYFTDKIAKGLKSAPGARPAPWGPSHEAIAAGAARGAPGSPERAEWEAKNR